MIAPKVSWWLPLWKKLRSHNSNRLWGSSSPSLHIGFICFMAMGRLWKVAASVTCDPLIHSTLKASSRSTWRRNSQVVPTKNGIERTLTHIVTLSCLFGTSPVHKGALRVWVVNLRSEGWKANTKGDFRLGLSRHLCLQIVDHTPTQVLSLFQVQTGDFEHPSVTTNYTTRTIRICAGSHGMYVYFPIWLDDPSRKRIPRRKVYYCRHLTVSWHVSKLAGSFKPYCLESRCPFHFCKSLCVFVAMQINCIASRPFVRIPSFPFFCVRFCHWCDLYETEVLKQTFTYYTYCENLSSLTVLSLQSTALMQFVKSNLSKFQRVNLSIAFLPDWKGRCLALLFVGIWS